MKRMYVALSLWMLGDLLLGCASPSAQRQLELAPSQGEFSETLAAGPRFPRIRSAPSTPKQAPPPTQTPKAPDKPPAPPPQPQHKPPPEAQPQHKPASSSPAFTRWLDPKVARERFDQGMAEARRAYPHLYGKPGHEHHAHPIYLGGPKDGPTVQLDPAYHQLITNAFRKAHKYAQPEPTPERLKEIMQEVYSRYPLPGVHF